MNDLKMTNAGDYVANQQSKPAQARAALEQMYNRLDNLDGMYSWETEYNQVLAVLESAPALDSE